MNNCVVQLFSYGDFLKGRSGHTLKVIMRHEVPVALTVNMVAFWHLLLCSCLENCQCFRGLYCHP